MKQWSEVVSGPLGTAVASVNCVSVMGSKHQDLYSTRLLKPSILTGHIMDKYGLKAAAIPIHAVDGYRILIAERGERILVPGSSRLGLWCWEWFLWRDSECFRNWTCTQKCSHSVLRSLDPWRSKLGMLGHLELHQYSLPHIPTLLVWV